MGVTNGSLTTEEFCQDRQQWWFLLVNRFLVYLLMMQLFTYVYSFLLFY